MKCLIKTFGWAIVSGVVFWVSAMIAGSEWWPATVATLIAVSAKTPFYAIYEWAFHLVWPNDNPKAEPLEHACYQG